MNAGDKSSWSLEPFNDAVNGQDLRREWEEWHRSFELLMEVRNVQSQHEKLVLLLTMGGRGLQRIYYNLGPVSEEVYPESVKVPLMPKESPEFDNAVKRLQKFFVGKRNDRIELELFRSLKQTNDESFNNFVLRLRIQATRCDFKEREEMEILHQITMGAKDERVRDKGLENVFNFDELTNYAVNREILTKQRDTSRQFGGENIPLGVAAIHQGRMQRPKFMDTRSDHAENRTSRGRRFNRSDVALECGRCGSFRHQLDSRSCPAQNARCNKCGRMGHYARKCKSVRTFMPKPRKQWNTAADEANSLAQETKWNETLPRRPTQEDMVKVDE